MAKHEIGEYTIEDDSNDDLLITHSNGDILKYDKSADKIDLLKTVKSIETGTATINSGEGVGVPGSTTDPALSFDTWRAPDANRPVLVAADSKTVTDGTDRAWVSFEVDESGGTSPDYRLRLSYADPGLGSGGEGWGSVTHLLPPGASYRIENTSDPSSSNLISDNREMVL